MCPPSDCSRFGRLIAPGQLILERDVLEVSLGCLIRYSGGWPSGAGMSPTTVYVPRIALSTRSTQTFVR